MPGTAQARARGALAQRAAWRERVVELLPLAGVCGLFLLAATAWNLATPPFEGFDEPDHLAYETYLRHNHVPPPLPSEYFEAHQPPLYYYLEAGVMKVFRLPDPPPSIPRPPNETHAGLYQHTGFSCRFCDGVRTIRILREVTALIGVLTLITIYLLVRVVFPGGRTIALAVAATAGLIPQFVFLNSLVNNDAVSYLTGSLMLLSAVALVGSQGRRLLAWAVMGGAATGLGLLTKEYTFALIPLLPLAVVMARPGWLTGLQALALLAVTSLLVASPWLAHNWFAYHSLWPFRLERENIGRIFPQTVVPRTAIDPIFRGRFLQEMRETFWYRGGWGQVRMPAWLSTVLDLATLPVLFGSAGLVWRPERLGLDGRQVRCLVVLAVALVLVFAGAVYSNLTYQQFQGRWMLPAVGAAASFLVLGTAQVLPGRLGGLRFWLVPGLMSLFCAYIFLAVARPAYGG